eukprot:TRINITY_DN120796_c0_g1_i1.p1 TRINITY_DN120796_c0_g1~~TRINITY_DN120796_c0_g1_i1.p1  ORF type:complete len:563 (-),score=150.17 TRINITY_DN120796_c0_g1_i1:273-1961(-)
MGVGQGRHHNGEELQEQVTGYAAEEVGRIAAVGRYHRLPKRLEDDYDIPKAKALGSGYNGAVLLATSKTSPTQKYAVKAFKLSGVTPEKKEELVTEAKIFLGMDHPHIARLVDVYESDDRLSLVMECMEGGELFDRVVKLKTFSQKDAVEATYQMLLAVNYIHGCGVVHRDLKLENFLYERKDGDHLKLIDFGFSKIWDKNTKMELSCGTLSYVAPEVLQKRYTSQCDLWSLGVIVFILLVGYMPFHGASEVEQVQKIKHGKYTIKKEKWDKVSEEAKNFMSKLLVVDPEVRMTAEQALQHEWILSRKDPMRRSNPSFGQVDKEIVDSLCTFAKKSMFRRKCMQMMAWSLTNEERAEVRGAFLQMDVSQSGKVSLQALKEILQERYHVEEDTAIEVFNAMDFNGDEEINYSEFLAAMMSSRLRLHDELLKATFRRFDNQNSGFIARQHLEEVLGEPVDAQIFEEIDTNKDGKIQIEEFIAYLHREEASSKHREAAHTLIDKTLENEEFTTATFDSSAVQRVRVRKRDRVASGVRHLAEVLHLKPRRGSADSIDSKQYSRFDS